MLYGIDRIGYFSVEAFAAAWGVYAVCLFVFPIIVYFGLISVYRLFLCVGHFCVVFHWVAALDMCVVKHQRYHLFFFSFDRT